MEKSRQAVILSSVRTGSTWLGELLEQHPDVAYGGETLLDQASAINAGTAPKLWDSVFAEQQIRQQIGLCPKPIYLWKLQSWQSLVFPGLLDVLIADKSIPIIFLRRCNLFEWYVSIKVSEKRQIFTKRIGEVVPDVPPFEIDVSELRSYMEHEMAWWREVFSKLKTHGVNYACLAYEHLCENPQVPADIAFNVMGLKPVPVRSTTLKMQTRGLRAQVSNYDAVVDALRNTPFLSFGFE